jgi:replicative DNA helicase
MLNLNTSQMKDNMDMEMRLIGKIMSNPRDYYDCHSLISEEIFSDPLNRKIYKVVSERLDKGDKVDMIIISSAIKDPLVDLRVAECMNLDHYAYITKNMVLYLSQEDKKIRLKKLAELTTKKIDNGDDLFNVIEFVEEQMKSISEVRGSDIPDIKKQLKILHDDIRRRMDSENMIGLPTGFQSVDKFTGGWQETDFIVIGGASSMGKTSLGLAFCYNCAKVGIPSAVFSYEMGDTQLLQRLVSLESEVNNRYIMKGALESGELNRVDKAIGKLEGVNLFIDECKDSSLRYLLNKIRQYVITKDVKFVLVDYLQLVKGSGTSREQEVAMVARELKNLAKELNITIVALSQLSRGVERRDGCRPSLSDLRESGEIEQASDIVMLVYRPEYYGIMSDDSGKSTEGLVDLIFAKGRNIGTGTLPLKFKKEYTKFIDPQDYTEKFISAQPSESF